VSAATRGIVALAPKKEAAPAVAAVVAPPEPVDPGPETNLVLLRIRAALKIYDPEGTGVVHQDSLPTLMRYLNLFVTNEDVANTLLPELMAGQAAPHLPCGVVEAKLRTLLEEHAYEPDRPETLFAAFRALDKKNEGFVELSALQDALTRGEGAMTSQEVDTFSRMLAPRAYNPRTEEDETRGRVYYADYVALTQRSAR
jgi:Ca2+-binding EF-hand superfamily protein